MGKDKVTFKKIDIQRAVADNVVAGVKIISNGLALTIDDEIQLGAEIIEWLCLKSSRKDVFLGSMPQ